MFTKRQKVSLIISLWLYFVWIFIICASMRAKFKGNFVGCMIVGGIGCSIVLLLYLIVFIDKYIISNKLKRPSNIKRIKSIRRSAYISAIYLNIVGFFILSISALLVNKEEIRSMRLAWFIMVSIAIVVSHVILIILTYKKLSVAMRVFTLQEKNDELAQAHSVA